jgi:hypothetical protein
MKGLESEKSKLKDFQQKKPPVRHLTVNLSQCSIKNDYEIEGKKLRIIENESL